MLGVVVVVVVAAAAATVYKLDQVRACVEHCVGMEIQYIICIASPITVVMRNDIARARALSAPAAFIGPEFIGQPLLRRWARRQRGLGV